MITSKIVQLARIKLLEQTTEVVSDETLLEYVNLVNIDMVKRTFTADKILSATLTLVNGEANVPSGFGTLYGAGKDTNENNYQEISIEDFDNKTLDRAITVEGGKIKCYPTEITTLYIKYYPSFTTLTAGSTPSVNEYFHECYIYGVLARAFEDLQDEELASFYNAKYEALVAQRSAIQSNYEENNVRGSQFFNYQQLL